MARGICVTATSELKVHSVGQILNLCLPCSNYNRKVNVLALYIPKLISPCDSQ